MHPISNAKIKNTSPTPIIIVQVHGTIGDLSKDKCFVIFLCLMCICFYLHDVLNNMLMHLCAYMDVHLHDYL
jgi:hypothetical protein